jgi:hypothetical protein
MGVKSPFLFSLSCHSKEVGDERNLSQDVSFPHHVHHLLAL